MILRVYGSGKAVCVNGHRPALVDFFACLVVCVFSSHVKSYRLVNKFKNVVSLSQFSNNFGVESYRLNGFLSFIRAHKMDFIIDHLPDDSLLKCFA